MHWRRQRGEIGLDHHGYELVEIDLRLPAEFSLCFGGIGKQQIDLGGAVELRVDDDVIAPIDVPRRDNSAMDGYAINTAGAGAKAGTRYRVVGLALAGQPYEGALQEGECVRITTGAWVPEGADTIAIQERARAESDTVESLEDVKLGMNLRLAGEDIRAGTVVVAPPFDIALGARIP